MRLNLSQNIPDLLHQRIASESDHAGARVNLGRNLAQQRSSARRRLSRDPHVSPRVPHRDTGLYRLERRHVPDIRAGGGDINPAVHRGSPSLLEPNQVARFQALQCPLEWEGGQAGAEQCLGAALIVVEVIQRAGP